jgi:hypothetical protein
MRGWRPPAIAVDSAPALVLTALYLPGATDAEPAWVVRPLALAQTVPLALRRVRPVGALAVDSALPPLGMTAAAWSGSCGPGGTWLARNALRALRLMPVRLRLAG